MEHGIRPDGTFGEHSTLSSNDSFATFFRETGTGKQVPRAIMVDLEQTVVGGSIAKTSGRKGKETPVLCGKDESLVLQLLSWFDREIQFKTDVKSASGES